MIKTHVIKTHWWQLPIVWIEITFVKWIHITCLIYHFLHPQAALFWDVSISFWFFHLSKRSQTVLYSYRQMRRDHKIKFTDKLKANLWIHLDLAKVHHLKELNSPYIVFYLHFLNLNDILTLFKLSSLLKIVFLWQNDTTIYFLRPSQVWSMLQHGSVWLILLMLLNSFIYFFGIFLLFFITIFVFLSLSFLFLIKYQISATEYQPIRNLNSWFSGTVC